MSQCHLMLCITANDQTNSNKFDFEHKKRFRLKLCHTKEESSEEFHTSVQAPFWTQLNVAFSLQKRSWNQGSILLIQMIQGIIVEWKLTAPALPWDSTEQRWTLSMWIWHVNATKKCRTTAMIYFLPWNLLRVARLAQECFVLCLL